MASDVTRWGLIGASSWAANQMIGVFRATRGGEVVSVYSSSRARGIEFADAHAIPHFHSDLNTLLADRQLDAVYISTTNDLHAEQTIAAAGAGKHVLCEKPLATNVRDALRMVDACRDAGVVLGVNHHMRCQDTVRAMRAVLESGKIGDVLAAQVAYPSLLLRSLRTWRVNRPEAGAGVILDLTVHVADTVRYLLDSEIASVCAMTATQGVSEGTIADTVMGVMRTDRGALVSFFDSFAVAHADTALDVHGTDGTLMARDIFGATPSGQIVLRHGTSTSPVIVDERRDPYARLVEAFLDAINGLRPPAVTGEDGIASLAIACAVAEAASSRCEVVVDHARP